jgi:taurine dioxygenase
MTLSATGLRIERQAGALGAHVTGVDLARDMDDELFATLHDALLEHLVICIRDQAHLTPEQHIEFSARWGEIEPHPYVPPIDGYPEIMEVYDPNPITVTWHADFTYAKRPPAISLLLARIIPPVGGDTMFSNGYLTYENLSPGFRETIDGLRAVHYATELARGSGLPEDELVNSHPVARTHPETGRKSLFVNGNYTKHFDGWSEADSAPLLQQLYAQYARFEYTWRHKWEVGDLLIWDNRCIQHAVIGDTAGQRRSLHRTTIAGDTPR